MKSLKKRQDFTKIAREGQKWVTPAFVLQLFMPDSRDKALPPQIGFTVTKKTVSKKAVTRNRAKRRLREAARPLLPEYDLNGAKLVVIARKDAPEYPFDKLQKDLRWALKRLGVEKNEDSSSSFRLSEHSERTEKSPCCSHEISPLPDHIDVDQVGRNDRSFFSHIFIHLINGYTYLVSPILGQNCRYSPTCSAYMKQAILRFGVVKGLWLGVRRIFLCNPWGGMGDDPVPDAFSWFSQTRSSDTVKPLKK